MAQKINFVKVVRDLNKKLTEDCELYKMFEYRTDGTLNFIYFNGIHLWSDEFAVVSSEEALLQLIQKRYYNLREEIFKLEL